MATPVLIPVHEYLGTTFHPDCDYIDGEIKERHLGEKPHSTIQGFFSALFFANRKAWHVRAFTEQRVQTSATRFRIPDVCVLPLGESAEGIVRSAPLLCIEILSPRDTLAELQERIDDYLAMGVRNIWLFDPVRRLAWTVVNGSIEKLTDDEFSIPGTPIRIPLAALYAELDDLAAGR